MAALSRGQTWTLELRVLAVLSRYISARNRLEDGPLLGGGRSAVISDELEQNRICSVGGPK